MEQEKIRELLSDLSADVGIRVHNPDELAKKLASLYQKVAAGSADAYFDLSWACFLISRTMKPLLEAAQAACREGCRSVLSEAEPIGSETRVWFAKGTCSAVVPPGTVAVLGDDGASRISAIDRFGWSLAVWRASYGPGPSASAVRVDPNKSDSIATCDIQRLAQLRRPGILSRAEIIGGRSA